MRRINKQYTKLRNSKERETNYEKVISNNILQEGGWAKSAYVKKEEDSIKWTE